MEPSGASRGAPDDVYSETSHSMKKTKATVKLRELDIAGLSISLMLVAVFLFFSVFIAYHWWGSVTAQEASLPSKATLTLAPETNLIYPGEDLFFPSIFASFYVGGRPELGQNNWRQWLSTPNADDTGVVDTANQFGQFYSAASVADQHIDWPLDGDPVEQGKYYRIRMFYRAGPDKGFSGDDVDKDWDLDGGWRNGGLLEFDIRSRGEAPLQSDRVGLSVSPQAGGNDCSYENGNWCIYNKTFQVTKEAGRFQAILIRSGHTIGRSWFVGDLQIDNVDLREMALDGSGNPTIPVGNNLIVNPANNGTFNQPGFDITYSTSLPPLSDRIGIERLQDPRDGNWYLNYTSKNFHVADADPADTTAYASLVNHPERECARDENGADRFFQSILPTGSCYTTDTSIVPENSMVFNEYVGRDLMGGGIFVKMHIPEDFCDSRANGNYALQDYASLRHYVDENGNGRYDVGEPGTAELADVNGQDQNFLERYATTEIVCAQVDMVISSNVPGSTCYQDSDYTASPDVLLSLRGVSAYDQFRIGSSIDDFNDESWIDLENRIQDCGASGEDFSLPANLFMPLDETRDEDSEPIGVGIANHERGVKSVLIQFRDSESPGSQSEILSDDIKYGYPWVNTYRGDVHSNGEIDGEASLSSLVYDAFSSWTCNPPSGLSNADYIISAKDGIRSITNDIPNCGDDDGVDGNDETDDKTFTSFSGQSLGDWYLDRDESSSDRLQAYVADFKDGLVNIEGDPTQEGGATIVCDGDVTVTVPNSGDIVEVFSSATGCTDYGHDQNGEIIFVKGKIDINANANSPIIFREQSGKSGAVTMVAVARRDPFGQIIQPGNITIRSNSQYDTGAPTRLTNINGLASVAWLAENNLLISGPVRTAVGIHFAGNLLRTTSGFNRDRPLSVYGSLIANEIQFGRNYLGF